MNHENDHRDNNGMIELPDGTWVLYVRDVDSEARMRSMEAKLQSILEGNNATDLKLVARMSNVEALLLAILNQLRNGVKTQGLSLGVSVPIVSIPGLLTVQP